MSELPTISRAAANAIIDYVTERVVTATAEGDALIRTSTDMIDPEVAMKTALALAEVRGQQKLAVALAKKALET